MKYYRDHDPIMQGLYYSRHVEAMTAEGLHSKGAIASELAARDILIDSLVKTANEVLRTYMPQFPDSRAVDDCLVGLAGAVATADTEVKP